MLCLRRLAQAVLLSRLLCSWRLATAAGTAVAAAAAGRASDCGGPTLVGYSYPHNTATPPNNHLPNRTTPAACCRACTAASPLCVSWTFHPASGCWLHGDYPATPWPPVPVPCGDGAQCVTGGGSKPLPPFAKPPTPAPPPPAPLPRPAALATPSEAHLLFHEDNLGAISHFNLQTFVPKAERSCKTPADWNDASLFNPVDLDTDQWVRTAASFGAKYYVLVADHFSGFSLYNTSVSNYSVAHSPWRGGRGDIVADFVASCRKYGVRPGVYYSVHANWHEGVCAYNVTGRGPASQAAFEELAMAQLAELAAYFSDSLAEIWFDAGVRQSPAFVNRVAEFVATKLPATATCHSCQNFADDRVHLVSWMGNEETVMPYPLWNANDQACSFNGSPKSKGYGVADGTRWCPAHCDAVLRRHFWFWDKAAYNETGNLNTAPLLLGMHMTSVGRGCNMILDMSPTTTGLIQSNDVATYKAMGDGLDTLYNKSFAAAAAGVARGDAAATVTLPTPITRGAIELRENLTKGQAISAYNVTYLPAGGGGTWLPLPLHNGQQITIGNRRIHHWAGGPAVAKLRVVVRTLTLQSGALAIPHIRSIKVFDWTAPRLDDLLAGILRIE